MSLRDRISALQDIPASGLADGQLAAQARTEVNGNSQPCSDLCPRCRRFQTLLLRQQDMAWHEDEAEFWKALTFNAEELTAFLFRFNDPAAAMAHLLRFLPKRFEYSCELLYGKRKPGIGEGEAERLALLEIISGGRDFS